MRLKPFMESAATISGVTLNNKTLKNEIETLPLLHGYHVIALALNNKTLKNEIETGPILVTVYLAMFISQ